VTRRGEAWGTVDTPLAGAFNVRNVLAAIAAADAIGGDPDRVAAGLANFLSVRRRMEIRGEAGGVVVVDDFAHHPTAVRETIAAARQRFRDRRVIAVFEPRSYTAQRRDFQDAWQDALGAADGIVIAGLFHPERYTADTALDPHALIAAWRAAGRAAMYEPDVDAIVRTLVTGDGDSGLPRARPGDVVLVMSNGGFGGIHGKLLAALGG
jgi:UDP-N-acetylmuramate: L-alanyl-gamma-D-glutamyl-meso-diaminopimelate ligase